MYEVLVLAASMLIIVSGVQYEDAVASRQSDSWVTRRVMAGRMAVRDRKRRETARCARFHCLESSYAQSGFNRTNAMALMTSLARMYPDTFQS